MKPTVAILTDPRKDVGEPKRRQSSMPGFACMALMLATMAALLTASPGAAVAGADKTEPSALQLGRLYKFEAYVRYFTSISYGPNDARVSSEYLKALILTESGGHRLARSSKGARGLTQIMPATARNVAKKLVKEGYDYLYIDETDLAHFTADRLYDPAINILIACYLSATYHERFEGRTELVAAAWNAGPGAVKRYGNKPPPYRETKALIARILGYMDFFQAVRFTRVVE